MPESDNTAKGQLIVDVTSALGLIPVKGATVRISYTSSPENTIEEIATDESGQTERLTLPAPPVEWSLEPNEERPYAEYDIAVTAPGYETVHVSGSELLADELSIQNITMNPIEEPDEVRDDVVIGPHTLYYDYPPKIPEEEIKPIDESGEIVLSRVVIPEYIVVHDGSPNDASAPDYYVPYKDYIKNVASCEIYATWPEASLYANILAIMSFTLNRVFTEWYRNDGKNFTITSSTAYDQKWIYGRNIYENISVLVDSIFNNYLSRPGVKQPILTSYCDGVRVNCSGLQQWGSKYLADEGYSAIEILRYYYGNDMFINSTTYVSGVPSSYPGYNLDIGAQGAKVMQLQEQINRISQNYPAIPRVTADGIYGPGTKEAVEVFQSVFLLPVTGIVDYATWYAISDIYVGVSRIAELS
ncbi:MAG: peptidoglycan-binding protein [Lachnospiraceae bacterium]|nr:peptidoglycan-binding protein [Lachnospiraceae bacterium]